MIKLFKCQEHRLAFAANVIFFVLCSSVSSVGFANKVVLPLDDYAKLTLPQQLKSLGEMTNTWKSKPVKDKESKLQLFALIGELTVRERMVKLNNDDLKMVISTLVLLSEGDNLGEAGMVALDLISVLGSVKITTIIKDLDVRGNLRRSIKTVTSGDH